MSWTIKITQEKAGKYINADIGSPNPCDMEKPTVYNIDDDGLSEDQKEKARDLNENVEVVMIVILESNSSGGSTTNEIHDAISGMGSVNPESTSDGVILVYQRNTEGLTYRQGEPTGGDVKKGPGSKD